MEEESIAYEKWQKLADLEEGFLKQRAKIHWLIAGDRNNKYFYRSIQTRRAQNAIREIRKQNGEIMTEPEDIKEEAEHFFKEFLTTVPSDFVGATVEELEQLMDFRCSAADISDLMREVQAEEIQKVLFGMPNDKSPGPDGFTSEFFKKAWPIIGKVFIAAIQSFFIKGFLPKGLNTTILALIPKKENAIEMKDYRPISLCNVLYKVISKILANRLKGILPKFISQSQSAFVKERLLMENVLLATELVKDYHKEEISPRCAMKIDISKAFDSVQWSFLLNTLAALNFPAQFIHWIELCITTASFSVQINGELAGFFRSARGLRQGCALSPYLFVICMNVLSKMIDKEAVERRVGFHPKCKQIQLTHLCFADDLMVFVDGKKSSVEGIISTFNRFAEKSGLKISIEKSTLYLAGIDDERRQEIISTFPFATGQLPVRYLGLPLLTKKMTFSDYLPLVEQIRMKMTSWKGKFLSFAGRLQLLQSVIMSVVNFWIGAYMLPSGCVKEIEKLCSAFLWSGPELNPRKAKIAWNEVCKTKKEGGLGLKSIREANKVCCLKLLWRICSAQSLWVKWIKQTILKRDTLWQAKDRTSIGSWMWKRLLKYRELAKDFHRVQLCNGESSSFWFDIWSPLGRIHELTGPRGYIDMGIPAHATVSMALKNQRRRLYRSDVLKSIETEMNKTQLVEGEDVALWKQSENKFTKTFSSSHTWQLLRQQHSTKDWHVCVWYSYGTPKHQFITWLACLDRLATGERMRTWNAAQNTNCSLCNTDLETRNHLFFSCNFSSKLWKLLTLRMLSQDFTTSWDQILKLIGNSKYDKLKSYLLKYTFQAVLYHLWRERNRHRHGEAPIQAETIAKIIDKNIRNRLISLSRMGVEPYKEGLIRSTQVALSPSSAI